MLSRPVSAMSRLCGEGLPYLVQAPAEEEAVHKVARGTHAELVEEDGDHGPHRLRGHILAQQRRAPAVCAARATVPALHTLCKYAELCADIGKRAGADISAHKRLEHPRRQVRELEVEMLRGDQPKERITKRRKLSIVL